MNQKNHFSSIDNEKILQKYINEEKSIWITDSKLGKRKVIPKEIISDLISGKNLSCYVLLVEKLGDHGNRMDTVPLHSIQNIQE